MPLEASRGLSGVDQRLDIVGKRVDGIMHEDRIEATKLALGNHIFEIEQRIKIIVGTALQLIDARFANKRVRSTIALQPIVARTTAHKIPAISRKHCVITCACRDDIGPIPAGKRFRTASTDDGFRRECGRILPDADVIDAVGRRKRRG